MTMHPRQSIATALGLAVVVLYGLGHTLAWGKVLGDFLSFRMWGAAILGEFASWFSRAFAGEEVALLKAAAITYSFAGAFVVAIPLLAWAAKYGEAAIAGMVAVPAMVAAGVMYVIGIKDLVGEYPDWGVGFVLHWIAVALVVMQIGVLLAPRGTFGPESAARQVASRGSAECETCGTIVAVYPGFRPICPRCDQRVSPPPAEPS